MQANYDDFSTPPPLAAAVVALSEALAAAAEVECE